MRCVNLHVDEELRKHFAVLGLRDASVAHSVVIDAIRKEQLFVDLHGLGPSILKIRSKVVPNQKHLGLELACLCTAQDSSKLQL